MIYIIMESFYYSTPIAKKDERKVITGDIFWSNQEI